MNHDLERELQRAFRPQEPSTDFAERVMARLAEQSQPHRVDARRETVTLWQRLTGVFQMPQWQMPQWQMPQMRWAAAGALACLLLAFGVMQYRQQQRLAAERLAAEQAEGERAKEQVMLALQIASAKLNVAQRKINESSERTTEAR